MNAIVLVTGANGYLGTNLVEWLLNKNYSVRAAVRDLSTHPLEKHPDLQVFPGDLMDANHLQKLCNGVDFVVHAASLTGQNADNYSDYYEANVHMTQLVLAAAYNANVRRFVFISSANTIGHGDANHPGNESMPMRKPFINSMYAKSKFEAELEVLKYESKMQVVILNPTFMIGGIDPETSSGKFMKQLKIRHILFVPPGSKSYVSVLDVCFAIEKALHLAQNGQKYLLCSESLSYAEFCKLNEKLHHKHQLIIVLPRNLIRSLGWMGQFLKLFGVKTSLSVNNMNILCENVHYSNAKASKVFQLPFTPVSDVLKHMEE